jgi:hypothetical protein
MAGSLAVTLARLAQPRGGLRDKLLAVGRFGYFEATRPSIPRRSLSVHEENLQRRGRQVSAMKRAGHDAQVATDRAGLERTGTNIDVVVAGVDACWPPRRGDRGWLRAAAVAGASADQLLTRLRPQLPWLRRQGSDLNTLLAKIDEAMASRPSHAEETLNAAGSMARWYTAMSGQAVFQVRRRPV